MAYPFRRHGERMSNRARPDVSGAGMITSPGANAALAARWMTDHRNTPSASAIHTRADNDRQS